MADPIVTVEEGKLQGSILQNYKQEDLFAFRGIPYAEPPIGELRFKAPKPVQPWDGVKDATKFGPINIQLVGDDIVGSEDSLTLNIFTKELSKNSNNLKPVMFWVHGGAFVSGGADIYNPDFLLTQDIVLVTVQYRLGAVGFLNFEDPDVGAPGNAGMKDIVLALKWVQNNIGAFSGDANNVIIFGQSAGAAAVHYLMVSPMSKGLFHKAICQSGCVSNPWARGTENNGIDFANALGLDSKNPKKCLEFLQNLPIDELLKGQYQISDVIENANKQRFFSPTLEKNSRGEAFMPEDAEGVLRSGNYNKVPLLTGNTSEEGLEFNGTSEAIKDVVVPWYYHLEKGSKAYKKVSDSILDFYYDDKDPKINKTYHQLMGDLINEEGIAKQTQLHVKTSSNPVYFYRLSKTPSFINGDADTSEDGVPHGGDLPYLFKFNDVEAGSKGEKMMLRIIKMWTNFARTGNPTPEENNDLLNVIWRRVEEDKYVHLDIGTELKCKDDHPRQEKFMFWDILDEKYKNMTSYVK